MGEVDAARVASLPAFAGATPDQVEAVLAEARLASYIKGNAIFRQGEPEHSFWLLLDGRLQVVKVTPEGQQVVVRYIGPGDFFGIAVAMGLPLYPATASPVIDSTALAWPSAAWPRLVESCPTLGANALHIVGARLHDAHSRVVEISTQPVAQRIAVALLRLARQAGRTVSTGIVFDFPISRQDVADMTGTTLHTVSRILSAWESQGLVGGGRQRIDIRDPARLTAIAGASDIALAQRRATRLG